MHNIKIHFYLNDKEINLTIPPATSALQVIREHALLSGTKESCSEGDCGACTIAVGKWEYDRFVYRAYNSCIMPAVKMHGMHVVTVEGLGTPQKMHSIQQAMLDCHGTQCGFCTPGFIMSLFCVFSNTPEPTMEEVQLALEGNLCRCTGYEAIYRAVEQVKEWKKGHANHEFYPRHFLSIQETLQEFTKKVIFVEDKENPIDPVKDFHLPGSMQDLFEIMAKFHDRKEYRIIAGATDLMVDANIKEQWHPAYIDISNIPELKIIKDDPKYVRICAGVTQSEIIESDCVANRIPILAKVAARMGSRQTRNAATMVGNIANASPIADGASALLGMNAELEIISKDSIRQIPLESFYKDYKVTDLKHGEIIGAVMVPHQKGFCSFEKTAKRIAVDISTINSYLNIEVENGLVTYARISFGGIAKYPILAHKTQEFLLNRRINEKVIEEASEIAVKEFSPISDVRGSAEYRKLLIRNHIRKHLLAFLEANEKGGEK
ncbi:MAG TPA: FAD binding domain-containing protein [Candidatus Cloacimonadota bacterium]|nr:FAD binding domain-containing protein [Candidatus Cloacimonadota bacterium]HPT72234.1 FAD binding domain-containing protein [Candidatus Cloacimonadota bacterium]